MVRRVTQVRSLYNTTACPIPIHLGSVIYSFLAPSLMESLRTTEYAEFTHIVPGEADDWCASYVRDFPRSIIFTGDSDLLLYDYQPEVYVVFFKDIHIPLKPDTPVYCPTSISKRLKVSSLLRLAYALTEHRSSSIQALVQVAQSYDAEAPGYLDFSRRYIYSMRGPTYIISGPSFNQVLQTLDVRLSEFIHQVLVSSETTPTPDVFLPLLFEDPNEASAWKLGLNLRLLAYTLIMPISNKVVREYIRRAQDVAVQAHSALSTGELRETCDDLLTTINTWIARDDFSIIHRWMLTALAISLGSFKIPHGLLTARVISGDFDNTWAFVHLNARIQAVLYSLRMLKQCITLWMANPDVKEEETHSVLSRLAGTLESLPSIPELFTIPGQASGSNHADLLEAIKEIYQATGVEDQDLFEAPKTKRQKKREKKANKSASKPETTSVRNTNVFALLENRAPQ